MEIPDGSKLTLRASFIVVQGKLSMASRKVIDGVHDIKVIMQNTTKLWFQDVCTAHGTDTCIESHPRNRIELPTAGVSAGKKAILVVGGIIDIRGFPNDDVTDCPVWAVMWYSERKNPPKPLAVPTQAKPKVGCPSEIIHEDFQVGLNNWTGVFGNVQRTTVDHNSNYTRMTDRVGGQSGIKVEIPNATKSCILVNETYLFTARIRLSKASGNSTCATEGTNCPTLVIFNTDKDNNFRAATLLPADPKQASPDGNWFTFYGLITFLDTHINLQDIKTELVIRGPEVDVIMDLDDVHLQIPPATMFPNATNPCQQLFVNGDASGALGAPYPMQSFMKSAKLQVLYDSNMNPYYHLSNRQEDYSSLSHDLLLGCLGDHVVYMFKAKLWVHSIEPVQVFPILRVEQANGTVSFDIIQQCPESSESIGWITCAAGYKHDLSHVNATRITFMFLTKQSTVDVSYDDLQYTYEESRDNAYFFDKRVHNCWGNGTEVVVPSQTIDYDQVQLLTTKEVLPNGSILFNERMSPRPPSAADSPDFYGEFALLPRNILFDSEADDPQEPLHGGHIMIYRTPGKGGVWSVKERFHVIDGVEFRRFGQVGERWRYPINMMWANLPDPLNPNNNVTLFSRNSFRETYSRCINTWLTNYVDMIGNVAFNTSGHCFVVEDGCNHIKLTDNIGIMTQRAQENLPGFADMYPATFLVRSPQNVFARNVAAGSWDTGWFFNCGINSPPVHYFRYNVMHSNRNNGFKTFPWGWFAKSPNIFQDTRSYRNRGIGMHMHYGQNFQIKRGVLADNRIGLDLNYVDMSLVEDVRIIGYSEDYEFQVEKYKLKHHCWIKNEAFYGVRLHTNYVNTRAPGGLMKNTNFTRFNDNIGCLGNKAIIMSKIKIGDSIYNRTVDSKWVSVLLVLGQLCLIVFGLCSHLYIFRAHAKVIYQTHFDEPINLPIPRNLMNFCEPNKTFSYDDMYIADDGSLNPEHTGYGFIMNDHPNMTSWSEHCVDLYNTLGEHECAKYCTGPGSCMTKVTIGIDPQLTENVKLIVGNATHTLRVVNGIFIHDPMFVHHRRFYWFYLPRGNYWGKFQLNGQDYWPVFAEEMLDHPHAPNCPGYFYTFDLHHTPPPGATCDNLIRNGDFETGDLGTNRWTWTNGNYSTVTGVNGGKALSTKSRGKDIHGLAHFLDTRCMEVGKRYEIEGMVTLANNEYCNPYTTRVGNNRCPRANILTSFEGLINEQILAIGDTLSPWVPGGWHTLYGLFNMTQEMVEADCVRLIIDGPDPNKDIIIDNFTIKPWNEAACGNIILNPDFEIGDQRFWTFLGSDTGIEIVSNAKYSGTGYSLTSKNRDLWWHGPAQKLQMKHCIQENDIYEVNLDVRLEDETTGAGVTCDPFMSFTLDATCPTFGIKLIYQNGDEEYIEVAETIGPWNPTSWNHIYGYFTVTANIMKAKDVYFYTGKAKPGRNIVVDNLIIKPADSNTFGLKTCGELVVNGDAEIGDPRYWHIKGRGNYGSISMVPGKDSSWAFRHGSGRTQRYQGMWQEIDQSCMDVNSKWKVSADFRLFATNGTAVSCDKTATFGNDVCPVFFFQSHTYDQGDPFQDGQLMNSVTGGWDANSWNHYEAIFTMTANHKAKEHTWFWIHNVLPGYSYEVDNISIVRV